MSKRSLEIILGDIIEEIERINRFTKEIVDVEVFSENELVFYAILKSLEKIGYVHLK